MDGNTVGTLRIVHDPSDAVNVNGVLSNMLRSQSGPATLQGQSYMSQLAGRAPVNTRAASHAHNSRKNTGKSSLADMNSFFDNLSVHAHGPREQPRAASSSHDDLVRLVASAPSHRAGSADEEWSNMAQSMDAAVHLYHTEGDAALEKALQGVSCHAVCLNPILVGLVCRCFHACMHFDVRVTTLAYMYTCMSSPAPIQGMSNLSWCQMRVRP
jgi:hypothetical protein